MIKGTLITSSGIELPCIVLPICRPLFPVGQEVIVYCQNRLVKGYVFEDDYDMIAEISIVVEYANIPEYNFALCTE